MVAPESTCGATAGERGSVSEQLHQTDQREHDRRVEAVLKRARRETGIRDLVTFGLAAMWTTLLDLGAVFYALLTERHVRPPTEPRSSRRTTDS